MRLNQVEITVKRFGEQVPKGYPKDTQEIHVYADANNLYEALLSAVDGVMMKVREYEQIPGFGCVCVSDNKKETDEI